MKVSLFAVVVALCCIWIASTNGAIMSVDLGSDWFKVMLMQGKNFDMVLNEESNRKTSPLIGFTNEGERLIGSPAATLLTKQPARVFSSVHQLLGKNFSDSTIEHSKQHFLYNLVESEGAFALRLDDESVFAPEEIVAMILLEAQKMVNSGTRAGLVKDLALVVPASTTQHERRAYINAAQIAGLNTLVLVNDGFGAAVTYAFTRIQDNPESTYILFYDMGAAHTTATLIHYNAQLDKKNKSLLHVDTAAVAWDLELGGRDFDHRLANYILDKAETQLKTKLRGNPRVFARLVKEAKRTKEILSANKESQVFIESITSEADFSTTVSRADFENLCSDLFERALEPIHRALKIADISASQLSYVQVIGGGARIVKIGSELGALIGTDKVGHHLNADEAAINGATIFSATQSSAVHLNNPVVLNDILPYSVGVEIELDVEDNKHEIFSAGRFYGAKKTLQVSTTDNFFVNLVYSEPSQLPPGTDTLIGRYEIKGIPHNGTIGNFTKEPLVEMSFLIRPATGLVELTKAHAKVKLLVPKKQESSSSPTPEPTDPSANGSGEAPAEPSANTPEPDETQEEAAIPIETIAEPEIVADLLVEPAGEETKPAEEVIEWTTKNRRVELTVTEITVGVDMDSGDIARAKATLRKLDQKDLDRRQLEQAKNDVEAFIYATREALWENDIIKVSTEQQREEINAVLSDASDWLYGDGFSASLQEYRDQLAALRSVFEPISSRASELAARPATIEAFGIWKQSTLEALANITNERNVEEEEKASLINSIADIEKWLAEKEQEQQAKSLTEQPAWASKDIITKLSPLDNELKRLQRRGKRKPKVEEPVVPPTIEIPEVPEEEAANAQADQPPVTEEQEKILFETLTEEELRKHSEL